MTTNTYSLASLTAREMSPAASCGLPEEDRAPLKHMIKDRSREKLKLQQSQQIV